MNTRLHDILDGDLPEGKGSGEDFFELPEERQEFLEHGKLREAMRQNANVGGLSSTEKADIRAGLAAAIGLAPSAAAPLQGTTTAAPAAAAGWYGKGLAALLLGMVLGAALFMLLDSREPQIVERTVGVPVQTATPSAVPFGIPEPAAGAMCDSLVDQLRDSLRILQDQAKSRGIKKRQPNVWQPEVKPTPGDN